MSWDLNKGSIPHIIIIILMSEKIHMFSFIRTFLCYPSMLNELAHVDTNFLIVFLLVNRKNSG